MSAAQITWLNRHRELMRAPKSLLEMDHDVLLRKTRERCLGHRTKYDLAAHICAMEGLTYEYEPEPGTQEDEGVEA